MKIDGPDGVDYIEVTIVKLIPRDAVTEYKAMCKAIAATLTEGARAKRSSIADYSSRMHMVHALQHINHAIAGHTEEPHWEHAFTRVGLAMCAKRREDMRRLTHHGERPAPKQSQPANYDCVSKSREAI